MASNHQTTTDGGSVTLKARRDRFESYEVFDENGKSVGRVVLPKQGRLFGVDRGTVYLQRGSRPAALQKPKAA